MWYNYLKNSLRFLKRNSVFSFITLAGLSVGMAATIIILLWIINEKSFDNFFDNSSRIYRVISQGTELWQEGVEGTPISLSETARKSIPEIEAITFFEECPATLFKYNNIGFYEKGGILADSGFFNVLSFPLLSGSPDMVLHDRNSIVISKKMAEKYFGTIDAVGKVLEYDKTTCTVSGVFNDLPNNSTMRFDFVIPQMRYPLSNPVLGWGRWMYTTMMRLDKNANPSEIAVKLTDLARQNNSYHVQKLGVKFILQPIRDLHLDGKRNNWRKYYFSGEKRFVLGFSVVALFILLIACFNYINLSTARAEKRSKEIGIRKVAGAGRETLVLQFLLESFLFALVSLIFSLIIIEIIRPYFNRLVEREMIINYADMSFLSVILGVLIVTGIFAGLFPALILSSLKPISIIKGIGTKVKGGVAFRKLLVIFQFVISSSLIIVTIGFLAQLNFIRNKNIGFDIRNVFYLPLRENLGKEYKYVKQELLKDPAIESVSAADYLWAINNSRCTGCFNWQNNKSSNIDFMMSVVDYDYFETLKIPIVRGRSFSNEYKTDSVNSFIVNETAARLMQQDQILGTSCNLLNRKGTIVGVFKDINFASLHSGIDPFVVMIMNDQASYSSRGVMIVRANGNNINGAKNALERVWKSVNKLTPFEVYELKGTYDRLYKPDRRLGVMISGFALLAMLICGLGIFGLVTFMTEQRTKEIAVRRVSGSTVTKIVVLISQKFFGWVLLGYLVALPVAWFGFSTLLKSYAYKVSLSVWMLILPLFIVLLISLISSVFQAYKAANADPARNLRIE